MRFSQPPTMAALVVGAATGPRPPSSPGRPGAAQDERCARHRPHVAVTHVGYEPTPVRSTRTAGTAPPHRPLTPRWPVPAPA